MKFELESDGSDFKKVTPELKIWMENLEKKVDILEKKLEGQKGEMNLENYKKGTAFSIKLKQSVRHSTKRLIQGVINKFNDSLKCLKLLQNGIKNHVSKESFMLLIFLLLVVLYNVKIVTEIEKVS